MPVPSQGQIRHGQPMADGQMGRSVGMGKVEREMCCGAQIEFLKWDSA